MSIIACNVLNENIKASPELIATVSTIAVASGITMKNNGDVLDITRLFYNKHEAEWENIVDLFKSSVSISSDKSVKVGKEFVELVTTFLSELTSVYNNTDYEYSNISMLHGVPYVGQVESDAGFVNFSYNISAEAIISDTFKVGDLEFIKTSSNRFDCYLNDVRIDGDILLYESQTYRFVAGDALGYTYVSCNRSLPTSFSLTFRINSGNVIQIPYTKNLFTLDDINNKKNEDGSINIYIPLTIESLIDKNKNEVLDVNYVNFELTTGKVDIPTIENPSINIDVNTLITNSNSSSSSSSELPPVAMSRTEKYLKYIATGEGELPDKPLSRIEQYLDYIAKNVKVINNG